MAEIASAAYAAAAARRVHDLGLIFPGPATLRLRLAETIECTETRASLCSLVHRLLGVAVGLDSLGEVGQAIEVERLAAWIQEEADAWPA